MEGQVGYLLCLVHAKVSAPRTPWKWALRYEVNAMCGVLDAGALLPARVFSEELP